MRCQDFLEKIFFCVHYGILLLRLQLGAVKLYRDEIVREPLNYICIYHLFYNFFSLRTINLYYIHSRGISSFETFKSAPFPDVFFVRFLIRRIVWFRSCRSYQFPFSKLFGGKWWCIVFPCDFHYYTLTTISCLLLRKSLSTAMRWQSAIDQTWNSYSSHSYP